MYSWPSMPAESSRPFRAQDGQEWTLALLMPKNRRNAQIWTVAKVAAALIRVMGMPNSKARIGPMPDQIVIAPKDMTASMPISSVMQAAMKASTLGRMMLAKEASTGLAGLP